MSKKKFGQTTVGRLLKGAVGLINPTLGSLIQGEMSVEEVITSIKESDAPIDRDWETVVCPNFFLLIFI